MRRSLAASLRRELDRQETAEAMLVFVEISSPDIADVIRVVSDGAPFIFNGHEWLAFGFDAELLTDGEEPPEGRLTVQNVDRRIGDAIRATTRPPRVSIYVVPASEFDESVSPRTEIGQTESPARHAVPAYSATFLDLTDVEANVMEVVGTLRSRNYTQRAWPGRRATKDYCPALTA